MTSIVNRLWDSVFNDQLRESGDVTVTNLVSWFLAPPIPGPASSARPLASSLRFRLAEASSSLREADALVSRLADCVSAVLADELQEARRRDRLGQEREPAEIDRAVE